MATSPLMNADVGEGAIVTLTAAASGLGDAIARVEFFDDSTLVGSVTQAPFTLAYHPAAPKLNFRITARVIDAAGHTALSPPVTCVATSLGHGAPVAEDTDSVWPPSPPPPYSADYAW